MSSNLAYLTLKEHPRYAETKNVKNPPNKDSQVYALLFKFRYK